MLQIEGIRWKKLDKSGMHKTLRLVSQTILEDILLVEVINDLQIIGCEVLKIDEGSLELAHHLIVEIYLRLGNVRHISFPSVLAELNHQFALLHFGLSV